MAIDDQEVPEAVLARKKKIKQGEEISMILIQWKGKSTEEAT